MFDTQRHIVDVDVITAEGYQKHRGFLDFMSRDEITITTMKGSFTKKFSTEDRCDDTVEGMQFITDEDDIMEFVMDMNQQEADRMLDRIHADAQKAFAEIIQYVPVDNSILLDMLCERFGRKSEAA